MCYGPISWMADRNRTLAFTYIKVHNQFCVPGPATQDGIVPGLRDAARSEASRAHIVEMLEHMKRHPAQGGPESMEMPRFWHPRMNWYGPAGIGTGRGFAARRRIRRAAPYGGGPTALWRPRESRKERNVV